MSAVYKKHMRVELALDEWDAVLAALFDAAQAVVDIDDPDHYTPDDLDRIDAQAATYTALHNTVAAQTSGDQLGAPPLVRRPDTDAAYDDRRDCDACGHRLYLHHRAANGAYRCKSWGCGCERVSV